MARLLAVSRAQASFLSHALKLPHSHCNGVVHIQAPEDVPGHTPSQREGGNPQHLMASTRQRFARSAQI